MLTFTTADSGRFDGGAEIIKDLARVQRYDHSVSVPELGSVFHFDPTSVLGADQDSIARAYGVKHAWVSTNGTTILNVLALLTLAGPGDLVLIQRNAHKSVYAGLIHGDLRPVYLEPTFAPDLGVDLAVTPRQVAEALDAHPTVAAVHLTNPTYFGISGDIAGCIAEAHARGVPVIVDEAHGSHLAFHPALPLAAEHAGADIVTQSTHKTCGTLSQGSVILFNTPAVLPRFYEMVNHLGFVSTSFSYVLLLSVMMGVRQLVEQGGALLDDAIDRANRLREAVQRVPGLRVFGTEARREGFVALDPLRVTVGVAESGWNGFAFEAAMIEQAGIYPEMASLGNVLFLLTLADRDEDIRRLAWALRLVSASTTRRPPPDVAFAFPPRPRQVLPPRAAFWSHSRRRRVPLANAMGAVSAETIAPYPPGSPAMVAGEEVTAEVVAYLRAVQAAGGVLKGASDPAFASIEIIDV